jgi:hypothetical protein
MHILRTQFSANWQLSTPGKLNVTIISTPKEAGCKIIDSVLFYTDKKKHYFFSILSTRSLVYKAKIPTLGGDRGRFAVKKATSWSQDPTAADSEMDARNDHKKNID